MLKTSPQEQHVFVLQAYVFEQCSIGQPLSHKLFRFIRKASYNMQRDASENSPGSALEYIHDLFDSPVPGPHDEFRGVTNSHDKRILDGVTVVLWMILNSGPPDDGVVLSSLFVVTASGKPNGPV
ncbi:MAG: hypothetical protein QMD88_09130 [Coprothermobacterota bacterium]|nr:hypothetical protein [Coprothermobacterota bacterium]